MEKLEYRNFFKSLLFTPLIIFLGKRSPIAFDEGYYILQSKWIIINNDWISPTYWGNLVLDRTIGIQYLIALSQKILGENNFAIYLPNTISGIIMLFLTSQIHQELIGKKNKIFSVLILSTTFLWVNYLHMATQDIIFSTLITFGIFSTLKAFKTNKKTYIFLSGIWIGLAVMLKTYLTAIPLLAIIPILLKTKVYRRKLFWLGILLGFIPFLLWSYEIISAYGFQTYSGLYSKLISLSKNNNFTNPFYYYLWNLPLNTFPWCFFSMIGFFNILKSKNKLSNYFLFKYPLIIMILLSLFSTKTPYYPLQILPLLSINSYLGLIYISGKQNLIKKFLNKIFFILFPSIILFLVIFLNSKFINFEFDESIKLVFSISLIFFSICWLIACKCQDLNQKLISIILGPYLIFSIIVQTGFLSDRSKHIRLASEEIIKKENLKNKEIEFVTGDYRDENATSKLIRLAIFMPRIGKGINKIENLDNNRYAWTTLTKEQINNYENLILISYPEVLNPWKLVLKE